MHLGTETGGAVPEFSTTGVMAATLTMEMSAEVEYLDTNEITKVLRKVVPNYKTVE